jgi:hypothetical protein
MLSAENVALENKAIQLMLQIREKELNYITNKYNAMGTQAALVGGFAVTTLTSLEVGVSVPNILRWFFFVTSSISVGSALHCILNATFVTVWGPGLALRGPRGSMAKAYYGMIREQGQIFGSFVTCLFFFGLETCVAFFIIDYQKDASLADGNDVRVIESYFALIIMLGLGCYAVYCLYLMYGRFHALSPDELDLRFSMPFLKKLNNSAASAEDKYIKKNKIRKAAEAKASAEGFQVGNLTFGRRPSAAVGEESNMKLASKGKGGAAKEARVGFDDRSSLANNGNGFVPIKDVILPIASPGEDSIGLRGWLYKKSHYKGGLTYLHRDPWKKRFFVLNEDGHLCYYVSEDVFENGKASRNAKSSSLLIDMQHYEVMINPKDEEFGFKLESIGSSERDWELRAQDGDTRVTWVEHLLKAQTANFRGGRTEQHLDQDAGFDRQCDRS